MTIVLRTLCKTRFFSPFKLEDKRIREKEGNRKAGRK
jgi:hypothetical protein